MPRRQPVTAAKATRPATKVHHLLGHALVNHPDGVAVVQNGHEWSYAKLATECVRIGAWLAARGVGSGDRILTDLPTSVHLVALLYACSSRGAILVPVSPSTTNFQLTAFIADVEPSVVIVARPEASRRVAADRLVVGLGDLTADLPDSGPDAGLDLADVDDGQSIAFLLYTSGSASLPKAVICPHDRVLFATRAIAERLRYRGGDVVYSRIPMSFDYGLYQALLSAHATCTLALDESTPTLGMVPAMREAGATVVPLVPPLATMLGLLALRTPDRPPVRLLTNTGAPLPAATAVMLRSAFPSAQLSLMYGLTECKRATIMPMDGDLIRPGSVGTPLRDTRVHIMADGELTGEPGVSGEIVIEGPHVMAGYWRAPELTAQKFLPEHGSPSLLLTGDAGHLDADGYLYLTGRLDDTFKRHGVRMSCQEIESAALDIPGVREAAVLTPAGPQDLAIFVVAELRPDNVLRSLADRLPSEKCPAHCEVLQALPVTARGKVDRQSLRHRLEGLTRRPDVQLCEENRLAP